MRIFNFRKSDDGKAYAYFDLHLEDLRETVYPNMRLVSGKNGWMVYRPSYHKGEVDGKKIWGSYPEMRAIAWEEMKKDVLEMIKALLQKEEPVPF